jgi:colicin import membrane protein
MNAQAEILPPEVSPIAIIDEALSNPEATLLDPTKRDLFLAKVREVSIIENPDVSTSKGREEIRTVAMKVTRAKTAIDKSRLGLTEEYRNKVAAINDAGKSVTTRLAAIAEEVRAPLTAWEEAEKAREAEVERIIAYLKSASIVTISDTSNTVRSRGREVYNVEITKEFFGKSFTEAVSLKESAVETLKAALDGLIEKEDQAAELQRLREQAAAREEQDRQEKAAREAAEAEAERLRLAALEEDMRVQAEKSRVETAAREAAEAAAREEREAAQREIDAANERAVAAEREAEEQRQRIAAEQAEADRIAAAQRAEEERRQKNAAHRREIMGQIKADLIVAAGITDEQATHAVKAMVKGGVRHLQVNF